MKNLFLILRKSLSKLKPIVFFFAGLTTTLFAHATDAVDTLNSFTETVAKKAKETAQEVDKAAKDAAEKTGEGLKKRSKPSPKKSGRPRRNKN